VAGQHVEPFVTLMGAKVGLAAAGRDDHFPGMRAAWLPGERDDGAAVAVSWGEPDPGVAGLGCADQFAQGDPVSLRDRQEQLQAGPALAGFQPGQGALGDPVAAASSVKVMLRWVRACLRRGPTSARAALIAGDFSMPSGCHRFPETATEVVRSA